MPKPTDRELPLKYRLSLNLQRAISYANLPWFGPSFKFILHRIGGYTCPEHEELRDKVKTIFVESEGKPIILCSNHLTMIDSMLLTSWLFSFSDFFKSFHLFPWNIPEKDNFGTNIALKAMCYLGKCVYLTREGSLSSKRLTWAKVRYLVESGQLVCIFPEGTRSRRGRIIPEYATFGVGRLVQHIPECQVLCVYLRGSAQETYSFFPKRHDTFYADASLIKPQSQQPGQPGAKEITMQIMHRLKEMEDQYFAR